MTEPNHNRCNRTSGLGHRLLAVPLVNGLAPQRIYRNWQMTSYNRLQPCFCDMFSEKVGCVEAVAEDFGVPLALGVVSEMMVVVGKVNSIWHQGSQVYTTFVFHSL